MKWFSSSKGEDKSDKMTLGTDFLKENDKVKKRPNVSTQHDSR